MMQLQHQTVRDYAKQGHIVTTEYLFDSRHAAWNARRVIGFDDHINTNIAVTATVSVNGQRYDLPFRTYDEFYEFENTCLALAEQYHHKPMLAIIAGDEYPFAVAAIANIINITNANNCALVDQITVHECTIGLSQATREYINANRNTIGDIMHTLTPSNTIGDTSCTH